MLNLLYPGRIVAGNYRLERALARGGMGALWVAFDLRLRRLVAIKFIHPTAAQREEAHVRFEREARATAQIRSHNVIHIYDYGVDEGQAFLVMELLEGEDLGALLERERCVSLSRASKLLGQIAKGLGAVHAASVIHRDMKPGNIFLSLAEDEETVKLIDFGAARLASRHEPRTTSPGEIIGTLHYMSPEQTRGEMTLDHRADLWALAVILFRMITGARPFLGATVDDLIRSIRSDRVTPPSHVVESVPAAVDEFFERAFSRSPEARFSSALEFSSSFLAAATSTRSRAPRGAQRAVRRQPRPESVTVAYHVSQG